MKQWQSMRGNYIVIAMKYIMEIVGMSQYHDILKLTTDLQIGATKHLYLSQFLVELKISPWHE